MKTLFVQAPTNPHVWGGDAIFVVEPLWAEYLGAGLKDAHDVRLFDMRVQKTPLEDEIRAFEPDVIGMTAYTVDVNTVKRLAKEAKRLNPDIRVVVGGFFANKSYRELRDPHIDVVVPGEGVNTLRELVDTWEAHGLEADLSGVAGLALPDNGGMTLTPVRPWPHLDRYPTPDRSLSADVRGRYFDRAVTPVAAITSSYSCPFRCEFCCLWPTTDGKYLARSPGSFVDEIETIDEDFVWFTDDEAFIDAPRMERIVTLLEQRGIRKKYFFMTRSDSIRRNAPLFERWARAGLSRVMVGFESIRAKDLTDFHKDATTTDNDEAIAILQGNGIDIDSNFVLTQDFEEADFEHLQDYVTVKKLGLPLYFILTPFPGTVTHAKMKDQIFLHDYDYYDLLHTVIPTKLPVREFYTHYSRLYGALEPLRRGIQGYGDSLDELVVRNTRKLLESLKRDT